MNWKSLLVALGAGALVVWAGLRAEDTTEKSHKLQSVSIRKMADSIHAVVAADRQNYSQWVVQRLASDERRLPAVENWSEVHGLPVHAQLLRLSAAEIQKQGAEFSYTLRSLWPINPKDGPQTEAEQAGLQAVLKNPAEPFYIEEELGGRSYFTAVYSDRATLTSCVNCHNAHPRSPKRDFKEGGVMGAIVVRVPLEF